jgi:rootletin
VRALDGQLAQLDGSKREVEQKLSSIGSTLRRIAGIQLDGSVNLSNRLHSPTRRWGHVRPEHTEGSRGGDVILDVDPDAVRKGVRALMQQVAQVERERDDLKTQLADSKRQLKEQTDTQSKTEAKLSSALLNLRQLQEEKGSMEARLGQKTAALQAQAEALQQKTEDTQALQEKLTNLELSLHSESEEKLQYEDKLEKMRQVFARSENEKRSLQDELSKTEARATKLELQRLGMEGDIQRLQMMLQERDTAVQVCPYNLLVHIRFCLKAVKYFPYSLVVLVVF